MKESWGKQIDAHVVYSQKKIIDNVLNSLRRESNCLEGCTKEETQDIDYAWCEELRILALALHWL